MIPKIIHYCWFGGSEKSELILKCIESWKKYCPDYKIIEWNESNWNVNKYLYAQGAYDAKKWAFVSDVARLDILYEYGGIYLDTDVELKVCEPFEKFKNRDSFFSFENERAINTGMCCGSCVKSELIQKLLNSYIHREFIFHRSEVNTAVNRPVFNDYLKIKWDDTHQIIGNIEIITTGEFNNIGTHYGTRTWDTGQAKYTLNRGKYKDKKIKKYLRDPKKFKFFESRFGGNSFVVEIYTFVVYDLMELGVLYFIKRWGKRLFRIK